MFQYSFEFKTAENSILFDKNFKIVILTRSKLEQLKHT